MAAPPKQGIITLAIKDKATLHANYMPFIKGGGFFVPTDRSFEIGNEVFLLLTLLDDPERFAITGKVVWINHRTTPGGRNVGVGIQFSGADGIRLNQKISALMGGYTKSDQPTNTM